MDKDPFVGVSNKTTDPTHSVKLTEPELETARPNYLAVGGGSLPSQTDSDRSDGGSSLPKSNPPDPTVYINPVLIHSILSTPVQTITGFSPSISLSTRSLSLTSEFHDLDLSHAQQPTPSPI